MPYSVQPVTALKEPDMARFLRRHEDFTLFLSGNYEAHGSQLSDAPNSGNFKLILLSEQVVGVFCLSRRGNLLLHTDIGEPIFDLVLQACRQEPITLKGVIGEWSSCKEFWDFLKAQQVIKHEVYASKEVLYSVDISERSEDPQPSVRLLSPADFPQWQPLNRDYIQEMGLTADMSPEQVKSEYLSKVKRQSVWGLFEGSQLCSVAEFNARAVYEALGAQVRGFYALLFGV